KWLAVAGLVMAVAAAGTAVVLAGDGDQSGARAPFVLPALAAAPTNPAAETAGAQPSLPTTALPDSAATSAALAARVEPLAPAAAIAELRSTGDAAASLYLDVDAHIRGVAAAPGSSLPRPPGAPATSDP